MTTAKLCEYQKDVLCQNVYCSNCQAFQDFLKQAEKYSEQLLKHKELYRAYPVSQN